jgi:tetratricopeptide (TPR) repeat protein
MTSFAKQGLVAFAAVAALAHAARADRPPFQRDLDRCALRAAEHGARSLAGQVRFDLLKRADGQVYAAYVRSEGGIDNRPFERCVVSAMILWSFGPEAIDYIAPYPLSVTVGNSGFGGPVSAADQGSFGDAQTIPEVHMPAANYRADPVELNVTAARETLEVLESATAPELGMAKLAIHDYPQARAAFEETLAKTPGDPMASRGLAIALAESHGDLGEARKLAEQVIAAHPRSEAGHEALLRVCLAAKDDRCAFEQWKAANAGDDVAPRAYLLRELEPATRVAAARLQASTKVAAPVGDVGTAQAQPGQATGGDSCATEQGDEKQALCVVKRCLETGSIVYAQELSRQNAVDYTVGEWRTKAAGAGRFLVTRPIVPKAAGTGGTHDALWLVKMGDNLVIRPSNTEARQITLAHNACGSRTTPK